MKNEYTICEKMARKGRMKVIYKGTFISDRSLVKDEFHNLTLELGCIWHIVGKSDYFWLFLSAPAQVATRNHNSAKLLILLHLRAIESSHILRGLQNFARSSPNFLPELHRTKVR